MTAQTRDTDPKECAGCAIGLGGLIAGTSDLTYAIAFYGTQGIKDGPFYTAAGLTAGVDLALAMIEEDYGKQVALSVNRELMTYLAPRVCA